MLLTTLHNCTHVDKRQDTTFNKYPHSKRRRLTNFADETGTFGLKILYIVLQSVHLISVFCQ